MRCHHQPSAMSHQQWIVGWAALLGLVLAIGLAKVTLATMMRQSAYAAGARAGTIHELENETQWLETEVVALQAPRHLVRVMAGARTPFRARVELLPPFSARRFAQAVDE